MSSDHYGSRTLLLLPENDALVLLVKRLRRARVGACKYSESTLATSSGNSTSLSTACTSGGRSLKLREIGWASEEWGIRDADVSEVLTWTAHAKEHRAFAVYICFSNDGGPGLVRLLGKDRTASTD